MKQQVKFAWQEEVVEVKVQQPSKKEELKAKALEGKSEFSKLLEKPMNMPKQGIVVLCPVCRKLDCFCMITVYK